MGLAEDLQKAQATIKKLETEKADSSRKTEALQAELDKAKPKGLDEVDKALLSEIIKADDGRAHAELAEKFGPMAVLLYRLKKLDGLHFISAHGGGLLPMKYKADDAGVAFAITNNLL